MITDCEKSAMCLCVISPDGLWWSGVCAHLHLCTCVVLGANDSWHLATISGSLISIERFVGERHRFPSISQTDVYLIC